MLQFVVPFLIIDSFFYSQNNKIGHIRPASLEIRIKIEQPVEKRARFMTSDTKGPSQHQKIKMEQATYNSDYEGTDEGSDNDELNAVFTEMLYSNAVLTMN